MNSDIPSINSHAEKQINDIREVCERIKPKVVIACITYNHEAYLRDALNGFVMQKTDFPFVAIVHDDASTDNTAKIIKEFAEKYPNIILPIYEKENQYSKKNGNPAGIMRSAMQATGAKYIALCEGDDYWIDYSKLQKQFDFLETHNTYSLCFHAVNIITESNCNLDSNGIYDNGVIEKDYNGNDILLKWTIPTCSVVFRTSILKEIPKNRNFQYGDNVLWLTCATKGKIRGLTTVMGVYRRNNGGWTAQDSFKISQMQLIHMKAIKDSFPDLSDDVLKLVISRHRANAIVSGIKRRKKEVFKLLYEGLVESPAITLSSIFNVVKKQIKKFY